MTQHLLADVLSCCRFKAVIRFETSNGTRTDMTSTGSSRRPKGPFSRVCLWRTKKSSVLSDSFSTGFFVALQRVVVNRPFLGQLQY
jgi:hypothetical protein